MQPYQIRTFVSCSILLLTTLSLNARDPQIEASLERSMPPVPSLVGEWDLTPQYQLPQAYDPANTGVRSELPDTLWGQPLPLLRSFRGDAVTDRFMPELTADTLPDGSFSIEFWVSYHVNQVVGALARAEGGGDTDWFFGFHKGEVYFGRGDDLLHLPAIEVKGDVPNDFAAQRYERGLHRYWHQLVGTFDGRSMRVYRNGLLLWEQAVSTTAAPAVQPQSFVVDGYLQREPFMRLGNLVKQVALYDEALEPQTISALLDARAELLEKGILHRDGLHFTTSAPHVAFPRSDAITLMWETDRPAAAEVRWGVTDELEDRMEMPLHGGRRHELQLTGLRPDTRYFYQVVARASDGQKADSGLQTFRTAVAPGAPVVFAAISDTEARPHINARLASLLWSESPRLVLNIGDLSDGGRQPNRVEWTHEYMAAMGHLMARVPFLPVMGNGEDDFVWFERYHALPEGARSYYNYRFGDVEFFVLDSNLGKRERDDPLFRDKQRAWFARALETSTARWKVVAFHHPPFAGDNNRSREDFVELIDAHAVDLVLLGHHHHYLRSWPLHGARDVVEEGPVYLQLGGGGGNPSGPSGHPLPLWAKQFQGFGYSIFRVFGDTMEASMHDAHGALRDRFILEKSSGEAGGSRLR
jgi:hypothetical protein